MKNRALELYDRGAAKMAAWREREERTHGRLPPYASEIAEARARGQAPRRYGTGHVCVSLDWNQTPSAGLPRVVLPPGEAPASFNWRFLAGLDVLVLYLDADDARVSDLVDALFRDGVARVECVNAEALARGEPLDAYWPRFEREGPRHAA
jgi:hypothetical protein